MQQWQSVIGITDQILSEQMDPQNIKAMYFRAFSLLKIEDFDQAVQCVSNLLVLQADHEEAKKLL
jgi:cytochrome c-type biogenesis protein CcmH/NrfG